MKKYLNFIDEANIYQMNLNSYVLFNNNLRNITPPVKGKYAKIIRREERNINNRWTHFFTLQFDENLIDSRSGQPVETNTIEIKSSQIANLTVLSEIQYRRILEGHTLRYEDSYIFKSILKQINFAIEFPTYDISYFDTDGENISFITATKNNQIPENEKYTSRQRQSSRIGRVLKKLNTTYTDQQIEQYVNNFKATYKLLSIDYTDKIKIVTGDDIKYWYLEKRYVRGYGSLQKSCMRHSHTQPRVDFYTKFPDKIALCIMLDDDNKLLARALVWKLDHPKGVIFMDRIYFTDPIQEIILNKYALDQGWKTKLSGYNKNVLNVKLPTEIVKNYPLLPYLDTFANIKMSENGEYKIFSNGGFVIN